MLVADGIISARVIPRFAPDRIGYFETHILDRYEYQISQQRNLISRHLEELGALSLKSNLSALSHLLHLVLCVGLLFFGREGDGDADGDLPPSAYIRLA